MPPSISEHKEFKKPACPISCEACTNEWPCTGQRTVKWFDDFFTAVVGVGTLGAGFTFSVIFSTLDTRGGALEPKDTDLVRRFLIIAWLLFVLTVALASVCASAFRMMARPIVQGFNRFSTLVNLTASIISLILQLLIVAAFLMSARALSRYDRDCGLAATVLIGLAGGYMFLAWIVMTG